MENLILGTRSSNLAIKQANIVAEIIQVHFPNIVTHIVTRKTTGDKFMIHPSMFGISGIFTKELEQELENDKIDIAIHSLKDVPIKTQNTLVIAGYLNRLAREEVLISKHFNSFDDLRDCKVGTSSSRRKAQLLNIKRNINVVDLRGNITSRIEKIKNDELDAIVLSLSGVLRLGKSEEGVKYAKIPMQKMVPAPCQGILAMQCKKNRPDMIKICEQITEKNTLIEASIEREYLRLMNAACGTPIGGVTIVKNKIIKGIFEILSADGKLRYTKKISHPLNNDYLNMAKKVFEEFGDKRHIWQDHL